MNELRFCPLKCFLLKYIVQTISNFGTVLNWAGNSFYRNMLSSKNKKYKWVNVIFKKSMYS